MPFRSHRTRGGFRDDHLESSLRAAMLRSSFHQYARRLGMTCDDAQGSIECMAFDPTYARDLSECFARSDLVDDEDAAFWCFYGPYFDTRCALHAHWRNGVASVREYCRSMSD